MDNNFLHSNTVMIDVLSDVWDGAIIDMLGEVFLAVDLRADLVIDVLPDEMFVVEIIVVPASASVVPVTCSPSILSGVVISVFPSYTVVWRHNWHCTWHWFRSIDWRQC